VICDECGKSDGEVIRVSTGLQCHPECFEHLSESTVDRVFAPRGYLADDAA
jgi:hypothetical protein